MSEIEVTKRPRRGGTVKKYDVKLPILNITTGMDVKLRTIARLEGLDVSEVRRAALEQVIAAYEATGILGDGVERGS